MLKSVLIAGLGGFIGTVLRFLTSRYIQFSVASVFPWGTLAVNIAGSFIIGLLMGLSDKGNLISPEWNIFLTVGICGGFTTFSTLSNDAYILLQNKEMLRFAAYAGLTFVLGLTAVFMGRAVTKMI